MSRAAVSQFPPTKPILVEAPVPEPVHRDPLHPALKLQEHPVPDLEKGIVQANEATGIVPSDSQATMVAQELPDLSKDEDGNEYILVKWDGKDDREHSLKLNIYYRIYLMVLAGMLTLCTAFASSAPSSLIPQMVFEFKTTPEVVKASVFLFVGSFAVGPLLWAPLSELIGHWIVFIISFTCFVCFNVGCMLAPNVASMIVFRILAGASGSSSMSNSPSMISTLVPLKYLTLGLVIFALSPTAGPCLGPTVGGYISNSGANWRWIFRVCTIFSFVMLILVIFTMPETMSDQLLRKKARRLRAQTGDDRYKAPIEVRRIRTKDILSKTLLKPVKLLFSEPMLAVMTIYTSFIYGVIYLFFVAYPIVFEGLHHFRAGATGLAFLGFFSGAMIGAIYNVLVDQRLYLRAYIRNNYKPIAPEARLWGTMVGAPLFSAALFWFAWTSFPSVSFWLPVVAGGLFGFALFLIFLGLVVYISEVYFQYVASAMAANTVVRSCFGAGFPMFGEQMYARLNPRWASCLLAFISVLMIPIPFVFYKYGPRIRAWSKHAYG